MIIKLTTSVLDKRYLTMRPNEATLINFDLSKYVVDKPWGNEYLLCKSPFLEIWHLSIDYLRSTSMHCHPRKKTALLVLEGRALFSSLNKSYELKALDAVVIDSGVFHSTQALSRKGTRVLEFETPPMKYDLVRLEDKYGRANMGYEGMEKMVIANESYFRFDGGRRNKKKTLGKNNLNIYSLQNRGDLEKIPDINKAVMILLNGAVFDENGAKLCSIGDVVNYRDMHANGKIFNNVIVFAVQPAKN